MLLPHFPAQYGFRVALKRVGEHADGPGRFGNFADGLIELDDGRAVLADHAAGGNDGQFRFLGDVFDAVQNP